MYLGKESEVRGWSKVGLAKLSGRVSELRYVDR